MIDLSGNGGRFRAVVIPGNRQYAAVSCSSCLVGVPQHVAASVNPGPFAVPDTEDAVVLGVAVNVQLLRAPQGGGRKVFIKPRLKLDMVGLELLGGLVKRLVVTANGRATIAADIAGGV